MFSLGSRLLLEDEGDDLAGELIGNAEINAGDDHEPDHDSRCLHHLPTIGPLYPLELSPASLQEVEQAASGQLALGRRRRRRRRQLASAHRGIAIAGVGDGSVRRPAGPHRLVGEVPLVLEVLLVEFLLGLIDDRLLLLVGGPRRGLAVDVRQVGPADLQLRLGELYVGRRVLDRARRLALVRFTLLELVLLTFMLLALAFGARGRDAGTRELARGRTAAAPLLGTFAVASHGYSGRASARFAVRGVAPAPAAVLAQLQPLRVIPLALIGLVIPALALFACESGSDPNVSTGHCALFSTG